MVVLGGQANNLITSQQPGALWNTGFLPLGVIVLRGGSMKISFVAPHTSDKASSQHVSNPAETKTDHEERDEAEE